ncbi:Mitochondrial ATP synthase D chain-related protein [Forsythia ovata]|uniref:Mitochondrial ATP synthase D chain-related protein n=1 Tax=Forsythia ovata TaxID=205694 RepID=A0ABD1X6K5_9LAMI
MGPDNNGQVLEIPVLQNDVGQKIDVDMNRSLANGTEGTTLAEAEEQYWLDREASLQEKFKQLQTEKDASIHKQTILEEKIKQLLKERDENLQKEARQEEKITRLRNEKDACMQREDSLEEKIKQLQKDKDAYLQKEADLERKILQLESEKDLCLKKEVGFVEKIKQLENEVAVLNLKGVSLDERIKHVEKERDSWVQKQNSTEETVACLETDNRKLQAEVVELEESRRRNLLQENHLLTQNISSLQSQINELESSAAFSHSSVDNKVLTSENGDADYQIEATHPLVENLIRENAELVGKVNELYSELERKGAKTDVSSSFGSEPMDVIPQSANVVDSSALVLDLTVGAANRRGAAHVTDSKSEAGKMTFVLGESTESLEDVIIKDVRNGEHVNAKDGNALTNSSDLESDEIVQIPLEENEVIDASNLETGQNDEKINIPLSEAPLIGAPFRLISFVARYVSGADLVNKNSGSSAS